MFLRAHRNGYVELVLTIGQNKQNSTTYDHRLERTGHPVRSAIHKLQIGGLVVGSVTTSEYPLSYVFDFLAALLLGLRSYLS
jgi:hypothetical protein